MIALQGCPECNAEPSEFCQIDYVRAREPHDKNIVTAKCLKCGYSITVATAKNPQIIRSLWNTRTN